MDFKKHIEQSWTNTLKFIGPVLLLTIVYFLISGITLGILAPVLTAGYIYSLLRATREERTPEVGDLFSHMRLFLPLFLFFLVVFCASFFGLLLLVLPGLAVIAFIAFASLYLLPLMTDQELGLLDAIKESWRHAVKPPMTDHLVITVVYVLILSVGGALPLAILIAQPLATFFLVSVYEERVVHGIEQGPEVSPVMPPSPPEPPKPQPPEPPQPEG